MYGTTSGGIYPNSIYVPATQGCYNVPSLTNGSRYYFTVTAVNNSGFSPNAIEVNQLILNSSAYTVAGGGGSGSAKQANLSGLAKNDNSVSDEAIEDAYKVWVSAEKELTLTIPQDNQSVKRTILYNNIGQIVSELIIPSKETETKWSLNPTINSGIYFIIMYDKNNEAVKKQNYLLNKKRLIIKFYVILKGGAANNYTSFYS